MRIPKELAAGDSKSWDDDPASDNLGNAITPGGGWTLKYYLRGKSTLDLTASTQGDGWRTAITAAQLAALVPGVYYWMARAESGSSKITLGQGQIKITPNLATAGANFDGRSQAAKDLDAVRAALSAIAAGGGVSEYSIAGRQLRRYSLTELIALESKLKIEVVNEQKAELIKNGQGNPHMLKVRFTK